MTRKRRSASNGASGAGNSAPGAARNDAPGVGGRDTPGAARSDARRLPAVAIACQGAGSHAAFVAGVLLELLQPAQRERFRLVGLSGASGGALSAALVWRGLVSSGPDEACQRLASFWRNIEVQGPAEDLLTWLDVMSARLPIAINVPPYFGVFVAEPRLRVLLRKHLELERLAPDPARRSRPKLFVGSTDVHKGNRVVFQGEALEYDHLIASAAVPPLFRAVKTNGFACWDGLFTTNPPVRELTNVDERPDEIWVVQLNPQQRTLEPRTMREIKDRSNELSGNLSLGQELYFIEKVNRLLDEHDSLHARYKPIRLRVVQLDSEHLDYPTKLDRRNAFIRELIEQGKQRAEWFFDERSAWPRDGTVPGRSVLVPHEASAAALAGARSR